MNRRKFVTSTLISGTAISAGLPLEKAAAAEGNEAFKKKKQQWYEWRTYTFANAAQQQLTETYLEQAALPAFNRAGLKDIGVFTELNPSGQTKLFLLIPFDSVASFEDLERKLADDAVYNKDAAAYLSAPATSPAFTRIESSLHKAFAGMPQLEAPEKKDRIFELRIYESPSEAAGQKKIEMFNDAREIEIFKKIGARPVFFGETMIGPVRPNLTYMLCFDDMHAHDERWKAFITDPEWKKISSEPDYANAKILSRISNMFLAPARYSQV